MLYGALVLFVDKKDGKLNMCIDYCALNKITIKKKPLLHIEDLLDQFNGATYFNQIDFKLGYYQIDIANEDVEKTTMKTKYDSYEFLMINLGYVMPRQCS